MHPKRVDGQPLHVLTMPDGRVFVDVEPEHLYEPYGRGPVVNRGGPEHSRHFCRFEDYGLADGLVRCRKCGLVKDCIEERVYPVNTDRPVKSPVDRRLRMVKFDLEDK